MTLTYLSVVAGTYKPRRGVKTCIYAPDKDYSRTSSSISDSAGRTMGRMAARWMIISILYLSYMNQCMVALPVHVYM